jgi:hypothetical protein
VPGGDLAAICVLELLVHCLNGLDICTPCCLQKHYIPLFLESDNPTGLVIHLGLLELWTMYVKNTAIKWHRIYVCVSGCLISLFVGHCKKP